jgi:phage repressor protein C with HTH and peptisase S24 domain
MGTLSENIAVRMKDLDLTQAELADKIQVSQVTISKLISGKSKSTTKIVELAAALQCSPEWLQTGAAITEPPASNGEFDGQFSAWDSKTPIESDEVAVPFYNDVELAAGAGSLQVNEVTGPVIRFSKSTLRKSGVSPYSAVCVKVTGTSMEPVLPDGSTVGINTEATSIVDGKIYALDHEGMLRIKRLYSLPGGGLRIVSYNRDEYPDEILQDSDTKKIRIIGRVFWHSVLWD